MSKYLWCEDSGSGYQFWCFLCKSMFPDITVESKGNNSRLGTAVDRIENDGNEYYILIDAALDNADVIRENRRLWKNAVGKSNVHLIAIHSFEFVLLSFQLLEQWVFAKQDELREKRRDLLLASSMFVKFITAKGSHEELLKFKELLPFAQKANTEQIAAKLLSEITRNTGFETSKGTLGPCFFVSCCDWQERQTDDICGLDKNRISADEKAVLLIRKSIVNVAFEKVGLSV